MLRNVDYIREALLDVDCEIEARLQRDPDELKAEIDAARGTGYMLEDWESERNWHTGEILI